jgi:hypothetical protein
MIDDVLYENIWFMESILWRWWDEIPLSFHAYGGTENRSNVFLAAK